jgi:hypothetical protein
VGRVISLRLDDLNISGDALVVSVGEYRHVIVEGQRCPVTGWVRHTSRAVVDVVLDNGETLKVTRHHRLYSADRGEWVRAGDLRVGEGLRTKDGRVRVLDVRGNARDAMEVFNLEVIGAHVYFVGRAKVLAHNSYFTVAEQRIAEFLSGLGKTVVKNPLEGVPGAGRQSDAIVNGLNTEFKTLVGPSATSSTVRNVVGNALKNGGQGRNYVLDARGSGLSFEEAQRGVARAIGAAPGKIDEISIIGDGYFFVGGP